MLKELGRHGHGVSYGTLYPALHRMEEDGLLEREDRVEGGRVRKYYSRDEQGPKGAGEGATDDPGAPP